MKDVKEPKSLSIAWKIERFSLGWASGVCDGYLQQGVAVAADGVRLTRHDKKKALFNASLAYAKVRAFSRSFDASMTVCATLLFSSLVPAEPVYCISLVVHGNLSSTHLERGHSSDPDFLDAILSQYRAEQ